MNNQLVIIGLVVAGPVLWYVLRTLVERHLYRLFVSTPYHPLDTKLPEVDHAMYDIMVASLSALIYLPFMTLSIALVVYHGHVTVPLGSVGAGVLLIGIFLFWCFSVYLFFGTYRAFLHREQ